ncbi:MAG: DUF4169 family protein [Caulobacteraceae bacterium]|nr:DUF4169 family protein [Caulobacteraceae bacterium]
MAEIINLNKARKARAKADAAAQAATNRAKHGRTKADKLREKAEADRTAKQLDDAKREP